MIINNIDYHVIDKCNQNCICCGHFCSLVPKDAEYVTTEQAEKDFALLEPYKDCFNSLTLTGGECTLNPDLNDIIYSARKHFPNNVIILYTNGITNATFGKYKQAIEDNDIHIIATTYPNVGDKVFKLSESAKDGNIEFIDNPSHFHQGFFSSEKCTSIQDSIDNCASRGNCVQYVDGKLYPCQYAAHFHYFDDYFKGQHNLKLNGDESIDLRTNPSNDEVIAFCYRKVFELCLHCLDVQRVKGEYFNDTPWRKTELKINEWYVEK